MVKTKCRWQSGLAFIGEASGFGIAMDSNPSETSADEGAHGPTPKQLALLSIAGCTAMDVVSLLQKNKQELAQFWIDSEAPTADEHPKVFTSVQLVYNIQGKIDSGQAIEAVRLSMTKFCGVSAMFSKSVTISYVVKLNDTVIHQDHAQF